MGHLRMVGERLFDWAFPSRLRTVLLRMLKQQPRVRLGLSWKDPALAGAPWEALYIPDLRGFFALHDSSIVRVVPSRRFGPPVRFEKPLRILAVLSNPVNTAPLER